MGDRVLLGMSGGVDSAAAAVLLRQAGCEPVGCTLRLVSSADIGREGSCCSLEDVEDARAVAARLGIDFFVFNFKDLFRRQVMDHFVAEYQAGRTPNPCVQCNRYVKFTALLRRADDLGIPYIATGHYARVAWDQARGRWQLLRGADRRKDQSYFLYPLTQDVLGRLRLPVGDYTKDQIRGLAEAEGLVNARKRDSQDICFVPDGDYMEFLTRFGGVEPRAGDFCGCVGPGAGPPPGAGAVHRRPAPGAGGQRRPSSIRGEEGPGEKHRGPGGRGGPLQYRGLGGGLQLGVPTPPGRAGDGHRQDPLQPARGEAVLYPEDNGCVRVEFRQPQRAVAPGQSLVAYLGEAVVGGGVICRAE